MKNANNPVDKIKKKKKKITRTPVFRDFLQKLLFFFIICSTKQQDTKKKLKIKIQHHIKQCSLTKSRAPTKTDPWGIIESRDKLSGHTSIQIPFTYCLCMFL